MKSNESTLIGKCVISNFHFFLFVFFFFLFLSRVCGIFRCTYSSIRFPGIFFPFFVLTWSSFRYLSPRAVRYPGKMITLFALSSRVSNSPGLHDFSKPHTISIMIRERMARERLYPDRNIKKKRTARGKKKGGEGKETFFGCVIRSRAGVA